MISLFVVMSGSKNRASDVIVGIEAIIVGIEASSTLSIFRSMVLVKAGCHMTKFSNTYSFEIFLLNYFPNILENLVM